MKNQFVLTSCTKIVVLSTPTIIVGTNIIFISLELYNLTLAADLWISLTIIKVMSDFFTIDKRLQNKVVFWYHQKYL